jgi:DNA-binding HxlR family transcriptional regulator
MAKRRSYDQFCTLALALDIIGERWTLLIVRDLLTGPQRFTDLQEGLPGIGANLLSKRLKELEEYDLIARRRLPPPAASTVYELSALGQALEPVVSAIAEWGSEAITLKPDAKEAKHFKAPWAVLGMKHMFSEEVAERLRGTLELHVDEETVHVKVANGQIKPGIGPAKAPTVVAHMNLETYKAMVLMEARPEELIAEGRISLHGKQEDALSFYELFSPVLHAQKHLKY